MKCIFIGLCHDLAESVVGDIPTYAGVPKERKHTLEALGFQYITDLVTPCNPTFADRLMTSWLDYEFGRTPEGRWMRQMDKFECLVQAHEYEQSTHGEANLEEFQGLSSKISSSDGQDWLELLQQERREHYSKRQRRLPVIFITGDARVAEAHCALLSEELGLQYTSLDAIIDGKSKEQTYHHSKFLRACLKEKADAPADLVINLVEEQIECMIGDERWTLVCGFPANLEQLLEFERKVQIPNFIILMNGPSGGASPQQNSQHSLGDVDGRDTGLEHHVKSMGKHCKEINCEGPEGETHRLLKEAAEEFIEQAKSFSPPALHLTL